MTSAEVETKMFEEQKMVKDTSVGLKQEKESLENGEENRQRRRRFNSFRRIPRSPQSEKESKGRRSSSRPRTSSLSSGGNGRKGGKSSFRRRRRNNSETSSASEAVEQSPLSKLRHTIVEKYERKGQQLLNSFYRNKMDLAKFINNVAYLTRCDVMRIVPEKYRLVNMKIKNTKSVVRTLDRYSQLIMKADLKYNRTRKFQVSKLLVDKEAELRQTFTEEEVEEILKVITDAYEARFTRISEQQAKLFDELLKEYDIPLNERETVDEKVKEMEERELARRERRAEERKEDKEHPRGGRHRRNREQKGHEDQGEKENKEESKEHDDKEEKEQQGEGDKEGETED